MCRQSKTGDVVNVIVNGNIYINGNVETNRNNQVVEVTTKEAPVRKKMGRKIWKSLVELFNKIVTIAIGICQLITLIVPMM